MQQPQPKDSRITRASTILWLRLREVTAEGRGFRMVNGRRRWWEPPLASRPTAVLGTNFPLLRILPRRKALGALEELLPACTKWICMSQGANCGRHMDTSLRYPLEKGLSAWLWGVAELTASSCEHFQGLPQFQAEITLLGAALRQWLGTEEVPGPEHFTQCGTSLMDSLYPGAFHCAGRVSVTLASRFWPCLVLFPHFSFHRCYIPIKPSALLTLTVCFLEQLVCDKPQLHIFCLRAIKCIRITFKT